MPLRERSIRRLDTMKRSDRRILTSHVGSLPRPDSLIEINRAKFAGEAYDASTFAARLSAAVEEVCRKQAEIGIDVINDGEYGKTTSGPIDYGAWSSYAWGRLSGWEPGEPGRLPALAGRRDRLKFAEFYRELDTTSFRSSSSLGGRPPVFTGPIAYVGHQALQADLANFKSALAKVKAAEGFITSVAPGSFARRQNRYYASDEAFLHALGEAMREEYQAIVEAGFVLQLDDPGLPDTWDMADPEPSLEARGITDLGAAQTIAAMAADIEECANLTRRVAHDKDRVFAHVSGKKITRLRNLAVVAQEQPAARENLLELLLVDLLLDEDAATDQAVLGIDELEHIGRHRPSLYWFCWRRRGIRSIEPASTVRMVPVMPLAFVRELRNT